MVIAPKISPITIAVMIARRAIRCRAAAMVDSTASAKRPLSRFSCPNAWTIFIAPSVSVTIAPTSAIRSCEVRDRPRTLRPISAIGAIISGIASSSNAASFGEIANR